MFWILQHLSTSLTSLRDWIQRPHKQTQLPDIRWHQEFRIRLLHCHYVKSTMQLHAVPFSAKKSMESKESNRTIHRNTKVENKILIKKENTVQINKQICTFVCVCLSHYWLHSLDTSVFIYCLLFTLKFVCFCFYWIKNFWSCHKLTKAAWKTFLTQLWDY